MGAMSIPIAEHAAHLIYTHYTCRSGTTLLAPTPHARICIHYSKASRSAACGVPAHIVLTVSGLLSARNQNTGSEIATIIGRLELLLPAIERDVHLPSRPSQCRDTSPGLVCGGSRSRSSLRFLDIQRHPGVRRASDKNCFKIKAHKLL